METVVQDIVQMTDSVVKPLVVLAKLALQERVRMYLMVMTLIGIVVLVIVTEVIVTGTAAVPLTLTGGSTSVLTVSFVKIVTRHVSQ